MTAFLNPFSITIWLCIGLSYVMVSVTLHTVARFTPMEWVLSDACDLATDPEVIHLFFFCTQCLVNDSEHAQVILILILILILVLILIPRWWRRTCG